MGEGEFMKKEKERKKILKIRPFNMANFSGGSGYLVFSVIYQIFAIFPAMIVIWLCSLIKLPKHKDTELIDSRLALKRYYAVSLPICILLVIMGLTFAILGNYGTFADYWFEILFIGLTPGVGLFFIMRYCHELIVDEYNAQHDKKIIVKYIVVSIIATVLLLFVVIFITLVLDTVFTEIAERKEYDY